MPGKLSFISVGQGGVWGLTPQNQVCTPGELTLCVYQTCPKVLYREGTYDLPGEGEGTDWTGVDGMMVWLACGEGVVWAASAGGQVWKRENFPTVVVKHFTVVITIHYRCLYFTTVIYTSVMSPSLPCCPLH